MDLNRYWIFIILLLVSASLLNTGFAAQDFSRNPAPYGGRTLQLQPGRGLLNPPRSGPTLKVSPALLALQRAYIAWLAAPTKSFQPSDPAMPVQGDRVLIDAAASGSTATLRADLLALGMTGASSAGRMVSGRFPIVALDRLAGLASLRLVRPAYFMSSAGLTTSQGDVATNSDDVRGAFAVDGSGVTVGTLSDSYNCLGGAAADVASGDLPSGVNLLADPADCTGRSDEGRAMMQLIHDLAPGASQAFHTAVGSGQAGFANGILDLANIAGADVIVDDVRYLAEPMFQDGVIAQAVDTVAGMGVRYFASAGNMARNSYESAFRQSGFTVFGAGEAHDFDPGAATDLFQNITVPVGERLRVTLQWDSPFFSVSGPPGSPNDLDIFLLDDPPTMGVASSQIANTGGDAVEVMSFFNDGTYGTSFNIVIEGISGPVSGLIKYVVNGGGTIAEFDTNSSTVYGHANAAGAGAVGATAYFNTPAFGVSPPVLNGFSSAGRTPILYDPAGNPLSVSRQKPEIVCVDGGNTTFFGADISFDPDTFPNFFGTSAAAPHAAAIAALMLEFEPILSPNVLLGTLEATAIDMGVAGIDDDSGHGFCQADAALNALSVGCPTILDLPADPWTMVGLGCDMSAGNTVDAVFGDDLDPADYNTRWVVWERDSFIDAYRRLELTDTLTPDRGYWVRTLDAVTVDVEGALHGPRDLPLATAASGRMNMVGNFYPADICWEDAQVDDGGTILGLAAADPAGDCHTSSPSAGCIVSATAWRYNGAAYETFNGLVPGVNNTIAEGEAIWVRAFKTGVQLRLNDTVACTGTRVRLGPGEWYQRLAVSADGMTDGFSGNVVGQLDKSLDGFDPTDLTDLPPPFTPYLVLNFPRSDWGEFSGDYNTDFRAPGSSTQDYPFQVRSDRPRTITLRWDDPHQRLADVTLVDVDSGTEIRPAVGGDYTVDMVATTHRFIWRVGISSLIHRGGFE